MSFELKRARLRSFPPDLPTVRSTKEALTLFSKYWVMMDTFESTMLGFEHPLSPHRTIMPHLCAVPMILESQCMGQVEQFCAQHPDDPLSAQILLASRVRYLLWFKRFIGHMCDVSLSRLKRWVSAHVLVNRSLSSNAAQMGLICELSSWEHSKFIRNGCNCRWKRRCRTLAAAAHSLSSASRPPTFTSEPSQISGKGPSLTLLLDSKEISSTAQPSLPDLPRKRMNCPRRSSL